MADEPAEPLSERLTRVLVDRLGAGVLLTDRDGTIRWASQSVEELIGRPVEGLVGTSERALLHPDDAGVAAPERSIWHETRQVLHADGTYRLVDCTAVDLTDDPVLLGWAVIMWRASARFHSWESERRLAATLEHTQDIVLVYGPDLELLYASPSSREVADRLDGTLLDHLDRYVDPADQQTVAELAKRLLGTPGAHLEDRLRFRTTDGRQVWVDLRAVNLLDDSVRAVVLSGRDVTEQVALEERLRDDALHDPLTGLPNRPHVMALLEAALADEAAAGNTAVLFLDLDRFKVVNDSFGHATGDRVLVELALRLRETVAGNAMVGRLAADEYVVIAPVGTAANAAELADALAAEAARPFTVRGPNDQQAHVYLSASIGISLHSPGVDAAGMLHHADAAMYRAKAAGRGGWEIYDDGMRAAARARLSLEAELSRAIAAADLELHYQPIIDMRSQRVHDLEALTRWRHPRGHFVPPAEFVAIAEETGLIHRLGEWALTEACQQLRRWDTAGIQQRVAVNVSPRQLADTTLTRHVAAALEAAAVDPSRLCLELTETVLVEDLDRAIVALARLRDLGVRLALDDFGTGWSSLTHLRSVPVDVVKIDRSFVHGLTERTEDRAIVGAVVTMCRALGKSVVAEGVETEAQLLLTRELGCTHAQGHLVAGAIPGDDVPTWLRRHQVTGSSARA